MTHRYQIIFPFALLALWFAVSGASSGAAENFGNGYTGAPLPNGGVESTCSSCHSGGAFGTPQLTLLLDNASDTVYRPGQTYTVTVAVTPGQGSPAAYGFQAQFLSSEGSESVPAGLLTEPGAGTQVVSLTNGRVYAEHSRPTADSLFSFEWTAPAAGTGPVKVYMVGNTVNLANGNGGDNGSSSPLVVTLSEEVSTSVAGGGPAPLAVEVYPNPSQSNSFIDFTLVSGGTYRGSLYDLSGRLISSREYRLAAGQQQLEVDLSQLPSGSYRYRLVGNEGVAAVPLSKL